MTRYYGIPECVYTVAEMQVYYISFAARLRKPFKEQDGRPRQKKRKIKWQKEKNRQYTLEKIP